MKRQSGFTLVELMVGLLVGLIVLSAVLYTFIVTLQSSKDIRNSSVLNTETSIVNDLIAGEIRRIGYDSDTSIAPTDNIIVVPVDTSTPSSCLKYIYDKNTGTPGLGDEGYNAFWLDGNVIRYATGLTSSAVCSGGEPVTSELVEVNQLVFSLNTASQAGSSDLINEIEFTFAASIARDSSWSTSVSRVVRVRNNVDK